MYRNKFALLRLQIIIESSISAVRNRLRFGGGQRRLHRSAFRSAVPDRTDSALSTPCYHVDIRQYSTQPW